MKIVKWLSPSGSDRSANACVRVEAGELADIEQMLIELDGDSVGHFGVRAELVKTGEEEPEYRLSKYGGKIIGPAYYETVGQFGFDRGSSLRQQVRYYSVHVSRD